MKITTQIKQVSIVILAIILATTLKGSASDKNTTPTRSEEHTHSPLIVESVEKEVTNADFDLIKAEDANSDVIVQYENVTVGVDVQKTYFLPGAGFEEDGDRSSVNFTNELIDTCSTALAHDFVIVKNSSKKIPFKPLRAGLNGRWSIINGYKPVDCNRHGNLLRAVEEIEADFTSNKNSKTLNLIGSSYGSVVAAQSAIALIERDNNIDSIGVVVITASMIDPASELGLKLARLENEGKIHTVYYHPNANDNITGCSGKTKKEAKKGFRKVVFGASPSIMNMTEHAHNIAANDPTRAHHILEVIVKKSPVTFVKNTDQQASVVLP